MPHPIVRASQKVDSSQHPSASFPRASREAAKLACHIRNVMHIHQGEHNRVECS